MRTYKVPVAGIGEFTFRRRTMRDQIRIEGEQEKLLGGPATSYSKGLRIVSEAMATLYVLAEETPTGWTVENADPLDPDVSVRILKVWEAFREEERGFRQGAASAGAVDGAAGMRPAAFPVEETLQHPGN
ncbi:MAG: hypothetical protein ABF876_05095 [Acetobacter aceti]